MTLAKTIIALLVTTAVALAVFHYVDSNGASADCWDRQAATAVDQGCR